MYLLDTDSYTLYRREHPLMLAKVDLAVSQGKLVAITIITRVEVLQGRMAALLKADSHKRFLDAQSRLLDDESRIDEMRMYLLDAKSLGIFDELSALNGLKIGRADLLIASIARAEQATLVTRNLKHFKLVPRLDLENWVD